ncbi:MAG: formylglycine-generating enzyme family protein, partial [Anaerolineales bacterium]
SGAAPPPEPVVETPPEPVVKEPPPVAAEAPTPEVAASPAEDGKSRRPLLIGGAIGIGILLCVVVGGFISVTQFLGGDATPIATQVAEAGEPAAIEATDVSAAPTAAAPTEAALPTETPTEAPTETPIPTEIPVPEGMALVPAGSFRMGSTNGPVNEQPEHPVFVDAFYMDLYEITNGQFAECLNGGVCTRSGSPAGGDDHPVVNISWDQAQAYCSWAGKRLPTEAEWEYAAGGPDDRVWPWGNEFDAALSAASAPSTQPVGSYPDGVSPFGIFDMAGNVVEWVADVYVADFFANSSPLNPLATGTAGQRVYRGGSYGNTDGSFYTTSRRYIQSRSFADTDVGFRCALDAPVGDPEARDVAVADFCTAYVDEGWSDTCP